MWVLLCGYYADAQQAQPDTQQSPPPAPTASSGSSSSSSTPARPSERRFSGGATLSFLGFSLVPEASSTVNTTSEISTEYGTAGSSERLGYGLTVQARIAGHFYLNLSGILRRIGYQLTTTVSTTTTSVLNGTTYPSTTSTTTHEDTRASLIDVPFMLRYYGTGKTPRSPRWFLEAGGAWRLAKDIRTSIDTTDAADNVSCCTTTPAVPAHNSSVGMMVGGGIQLVDEFGIHVVPEFRYTRWVNPIFEHLTTNTQANQLEATISLTF